MFNLSRRTGYKNDCHVLFTDWPGLNELMNRTVDTCVILEKVSTQLT
jgi:hypothetical protein